MRFGFEPCICGSTVIVRSLVVIQPQLQPGLRESRVHFNWMRGGRDALMCAKSKRLGPAFVS